MNRALLAACRQDLRAVGPLWSGCMALIAAALVLEGTQLREIGVFAYAMGSAVVAAHAFGHDYGHRTHSMLLAQPVSRRRLLGVKLAVVAVLTALMGVAGYAGILQGHHKAPASPMQMAVFVWLTSVVVAPALTIATRTTLAGALFSGAIPATVTVAGGLLGMFLFDSEAAADRFQRDFLWRSMPLVWAGAAGLLWRSFILAQDVGGPGRELHLPSLRRNSSATRGRARRAHPLGQLIAKELRLQQMVFAIAALYGLIAASVLVRHAVHPAFPLDPLLPLTFGYVGLLALVSGALASAEERQLGMLAPQLLLPIAPWRQWLVKASVVFGVSLALALVLPFVVSLFVRGPHRIPWGPLAVLVSVMASGSLFVSSLTTSGVRAVAACVPFLACGVSLWSWSFGLGTRVAHALSGSTFGMTSPATPINTSITGIIVALCFVALMLRFGYLNHQTSERRPRQLVFQLALAGTLVVVASSLTSLVSRLP